MTEVSHDLRDDYADDPFHPYSLIDRLFLGIEPIHFVFLALLPCWWSLAPGVLGWAALGLLAARHSGARRNAIILLLTAIGQHCVLGAYLLATRVCP